MLHRRWAHRFHFSRRLRFLSPSGRNQAVISSVPQMQCSLRQSSASRLNSSRTKASVDGNRGIDQPAPCSAQRTSSSHLGRLGKCRYRRAKGRDYLISPKLRQVGTAPVRFRRGWGFEEQTSSGLGLGFWIGRGRVFPTLVSQLGLLLVELPELLVVQSRRGYGLRDMMQFGTYRRGW
jgi:hypothetical protein